MKETKFIDQNKKKWNDFEKIVNSDRKDPDQLSDLFVQVTDDLSYSRTFYPNRMVRVYLNGLAQQIFGSVYKSKRANFKKFWFFWAEDLPYQVWNARKELILSAIIFGIAVAIGVFSSIHDPAFAEKILGSSYVQMTKDNIAKGDPMAVYKDSGEGEMAVGITLNNLWVAFRTYIFGAFAAIGSIYILLVNGIMVGTFQYFFIERGLFWESFLTIWIHGTVEISCIVIAGGAGIVTGSGLLFPKTLTRLQSFQLSARRGLKIMLGITPLIVYAGIVEAFLTRYTETPDVLRGTFILCSFLFIVGYFIALPLYKRYRTGFKAAGEDFRKLPPSVKKPIVYQKSIKNVGQLFADLISFIRQEGGLLLRANVLLAIAYCAIAYFVVPEYLTTSAMSSQNWFFDVMWLMLDYQEFPLFMLVNILLSGIILYLVLGLLHVRAAGLPTSHLLSPGFLILNLMKCFFMTALIYLLFYLHAAVGFIFSLLLVPFLAIWLHTSMVEGSLLIGPSLPRSVQLLFSDFGKPLLLQLILGFLVFVIFWCSTSPFFLLYWDAIKTNLPFEPETLNLIYRMLALGIFAMFFQFALFILFLGNAGAYYSLREVEESEGLLAKIQSVEKGNKKLAPRYA